MADNVNPKYGEEPSEIVYKGSLMNFHLDWHLGGQSALETSYN